jgi:hypothetical protein
MTRSFNVLGIVEVHVTGDNAGLWTALGALMGVVVGAGASWLQQRSKIGAEEAQLEERLTAESERVARQFEHDHDARELEAVRKVLSDASVALGELSRVMLNLVKAKQAKASPERIQRLQALQRDAVRDVRAVGGRLPLWFDPEDDVSSRFFVAADTTVEMINHLYANDPAAAADMQDELDRQIEEYQRTARDRMSRRTGAGT